MPVFLLLILSFSLATKVFGCFEPDSNDDDTIIIQLESIHWDYYQEVEPPAEEEPIQSFDPVFIPNHQFDLLPLEEEPIPSWEEDSDDY